MRIIFLLLLLCAALPVRAQFVCFSDSAAIYERPGTALPAMRGEACFVAGAYEVIIGGQFADAGLPDSAGVYNCDMLVVDYAADKTYVLPLDRFPPFVAEQFSAVRYGFTTDKDTAYLLGGYGFDLAEGYETTFPLLTIFPLKTLIDSVVQHKNFLGLFEPVIDHRLAVIDGGLVRIGADFYVFGGREIETKREEYTDRPVVNEWNYRGQLRRFTLQGPAGRRELNAFQICTVPNAFYQCMPDPRRPDPQNTDIDLKK